MSQEEKQFTQSSTTKSLQVNKTSTKEIFLRDTMMTFCIVSRIIKVPLKYIEILLISEKTCVRFNANKCRFTPFDLHEICFNLKFSFILYKHIYMDTRTITF